MITFFPNTPQMLCPIQLLLGVIRGGCMIALAKETPIYCSKFINFKLLELAL